MHDLENIRAFIEQFVHLSDQEFQAGVEALEIKRLKKNEFFLKEGQIAHYIAFNNKGYLRVYYNTDDGDVTRDITPLHTFATGLPSFVNESPSYEVIQATTDCELFIINKEDMQGLFDRYQNWERFGRLVIQDMFVKAQARLYAFIALDAETRYQRLLSEHPDMLQNVPLQYIASYLGVTQQSLSRLRRKIGKA